MQPSSAEQSFASATHGPVIAHVMHIISPMSAHGTLAVVEESPTDVEVAPAVVVVPPVESGPVVNGSATPVELGSVVATGSVVEDAVEPTDAEDAEPVELVSDSGTHWFATPGAASLP